jgi:hypothetical protein
MTIASLRAKQQLDEDQALVDLGTAIALLDEAIDEVVMAASIGSIREFVPELSRLQRNIDALLRHL